MIQEHYNVHQKNQNVPSILKMISRHLFALQIPTNVGWIRYLDEEAEMAQPAAARNTTI